jgi:hypothetical protein
VKLAAQETCTLAHVHQTATFTRARRVESGTIVGYCKHERGALDFQLDTGADQPCRTHHDLDDVHGLFDTQAIDVVTRAAARRRGATVEFTGLTLGVRGYRFGVMCPANDCATILPPRTTCVSVAIS